MKVNFIKGRALSALSFFFLLSSCSTNKEFSWTLESDGNPGEWNSARIALESQDMFKDLSVELIRSQSSQKVYVSAHSTRFTTITSSAALVPVHIKLDQETSTVLCQTFTGEQKLLIPEETSEKIVNCLLANKPVAIFIDQYRADLNPISFREKFQQLEALEDSFLAKVTQYLPSRPKA